MTDDYFNANYIAFKRLSQRRYIATQNPLDATEDDFWTTVWYNGVKSIVCLAAPPVFGKLTYYDYDHYLEKSKLNIRIDSCEKQDSFILRQITISKGGKSQTLYHFEYQKWPDFGTPDDLKSVFDLIAVKNQKLLPMTGVKPTPVRTADTWDVLVHCSAGCGRTGCYIAMDMIVDSFENPNENPRHYDPWGNEDLVYKLIQFQRQQRISMVQNLDQFIFCYEGILNYIVNHVIESNARDTSIAEDTYICETSDSQADVERTIREIYEDLFASEHGKIIDSDLDVELHLKYIENSLHTPLPPPFRVLDSNHSWMVYWLANAHVVLSGNQLTAELKQMISEKISSLVIDDGLGGICGGPNDMIGHVASTYAAVLVLALIEDYALLARIRSNLYKWLLSLKAENGSFSMHYGGEKDTRSTYCVLVVASLLNITTPELIENTQDWILLCQTYEGGFAGVPNAEAHGGYTFCAVASLFLLPDNGLHATKVDLLLQWLSARQYNLEGGFCGRSNKLVDACYSFWIGACFAIVEAFTSKPLLFNRQSLKSYILNCCQDSRIGGLRDKPGKHPDFYHTNYTLCGLSIAEHNYECKSLDGFDFSVKDDVDGATYTLPVHPIFGLPIGYPERCRDYFVANT